MQHIYILEQRRQHFKSVHRMICYWEMLNKEIIRKCGRAAYLQVPRATRNRKISDHVEVSIYLGNTNDHFRIHL